MTRRQLSWERVCGVVFGWQLWKLRHRGASEPPQCSGLEVEFRGKISPELSPVSGESSGKGRPGGVLEVHAPLCLSSTPCTLSPHTARDDPHPALALLPPGKRTECPDLLRMPSGPAASCPAGWDCQSPDPSGQSLGESFPSCPAPQFPGRAGCWGFSVSSGCRLSPDTPGSVP